MNTACSVAMLTFGALRFAALPLMSLAAPAWRDITWLTGASFAFVFRTRSRWRCAVGRASLAGVDTLWCAVAFLLMPESPYYLAGADKPVETGRALQRLLNVDPAALNLPTEKPKPKSAAVAPASHDTSTAAVTTKTAGKDATAVDVAPPVMQKAKSSAPKDPSAEKVLEPPTLRTLFRMAHTSSPTSRHHDNGVCVCVPVCVCRAAMQSRLP